MNAYARDVNWVDVALWLHEFVGPDAADKNPLLGDLVVEGNGWCAHRLVDMSMPTPKDIPASSSWRVEITDDKKGTMFALRWGS